MRRLKDMITDPIQAQPQIIEQPEMASSVVFLL